MGRARSSAGSPASNTPRRVRLVKGSHIVVPKFWDGPQAYLLQNNDKRVIFVNPYEGDLCADRHDRHSRSRARAEDVAIDDGEIDYLLGVVNRYFRRQLAARRHRPQLLRRPAAL